MTVESYHGDFLCFVDHEMFVVGNGGDVEDVVVALFRLLVAVVVIRRRRGG